MKHVLSVSLGSSRRDSCAEIKLIGERFLLERRGTDGSLERFEELMVANDGTVDCLCVGGTNLGLHCAGRFYPFRDIGRIARKVKQTPLVDGAGLKNTLERQTVRWLQEREVIDFTTVNVLVTCGIDRFGLAETLDEIGSRVRFGDTMFILGLPWALPSLRALQVLGRALLPIAVKLPFRWIYPTGTRQESITPKYRRHYLWADVIAGDFHYIRRHLPENLGGRTVLTNTTTAEDVELLRARGAGRLITSTPVIDGRTYATNVMEGVIVCLLDRSPDDISSDDYANLIGELQWEPSVRDLMPEEEGNP